VLPKTPQARKQGTDEQTHSHGNLKEQDQIGIARSRRS